ncbi:hypothetical protein AND_003694 [Anopheles darlingi]|uniref:Fibrinogen C-terminal domain-containing protein n=1 Tax=Anopheles darlingi TaxID=43151 RepID=W5JNT4_ANODA|nr:hypothetical protein AND_003694 [Anopheles darlingi]
MDRKLLELQNELTKHRDEVERNRISHDSAIQDIGRNLSVILDQQTASANHSSYESLEQVLLSFRSRIPDCVTSTSSPLQLNSDTPTTTPKPYQPSSCKERASNVSGVSLIRVYSDSSPFNVYCEMEKFDGGWIVLQHRFNGSVNFFRSWNEYRDGFGKFDGEFWLGLEHIHQLTTARSYELIVEVKDFSGNYGYTRYNAFQVGTEGEQYRLKTMGSTYRGSAGDSMTLITGQKFSTKDRDNDGSIGSHADAYEGAWWYPSAYSNLNGPYKNSNNVKGNWWVSFKNDYRGLSFSRMMIREL